MCSLVIKEDCDKEIQSQQSSHIGHIEYARNKYDEFTVIRIIDLKRL